MTGPVVRSIVSLLPSATEIVCALGLRDRLIGVTHECDYPPGLEALPRLTANRLPNGISSDEIDRLVRVALADDAHTIYALDAERLCELAPDVVVTQALCEVCAVPTSAVEAAVCTMPQAAQIVSQDPSNLAEVIASIEQIGDALGVADRARAFAMSLRVELDAIRSAVAGQPAPTVLAAEWLDPVYCGGHWVPEMIEAAGGVDPFGAAGEPSHRLDWDRIIAVDPDVVVLMPCGFHADDVVERYEELAVSPQFKRLRAVRDGAVFAVDATAYYSRPGPRLVTGVQLLARILHPAQATTPLAAGMAYRLAPGRGFAPYL